mmetsp:Transcript_22340/g.52173  ORF Transcript_22340/g.52173 Transcript_22340/m.52173 type:complete len:86 (+) Transcript_22340:40-297(+)
MNAIGNRVVVHRLAKQGRLDEQERDVTTKSSATCALTGSRPHLVVRVSAIGKLQWPVKCGPGTQAFSEHGRLLCSALEGLPQRLF